ncbi:hypothetical protein [Mucilaginibacter paludis]|uniref:Uncharacterized protein n=1 Tax=Mucilaginibacter paludis DSM 18603 TaxID=714943 RepID=H1Y8U9_9SPHI|nr:hypothetical protein [Mucilaginibacter paludis]EHQ28715.1 hypothetical protein Mucpa_4626 [Mucilaginibacter paludis DSM 18603]
MDIVNNINNDQKMQELAEYIKSQLPGCGFALITLKIENGTSCGNYVSNVQNEFMIAALERQLEALKKGKTVSTPIG